MPRKTRRAAPAPLARRRPSWPSYVLTAFVAAVLGSGLTWAALRAKATHGPGRASQTPRDALVAGNAAFDHKNWAVAVTDYNQAISAGLDDPDIHTDLGTAYRGLHQPQQALQQYAIAQREDPQHENSLLNQGIVYAFDLNDASQAATVWHQYLQRFPHGQHAADVRHFLTVIQQPPKS